MTKDAEPSPSKPAPTAVFSVRLAPSDIDALNHAAAAHGVSRNRLIGRLARRAGGVLDPDPALIDAWGATLRQLSGLATNLNQLARAANRGGVVWTDGDRADVAALAETVGRVRRDLGRIARSARAGREATSTVTRLLAEGVDEATIKGVVRPAESAEAAP